MKVNRDLWVSGWTYGPEAERIQQLFERNFDNNLKAIHFDEPADWGQPVRIAVRPVDEGNVKTYQFFSYSSDKNTYRAIPNANPWKDVNGWLHFTTPYAGNIIVSQGELVKRDIPLPVFEDKNLYKDGCGSLPPYVDPDPDPDPVPDPEPSTDPKPDPDQDPSISITQVAMLEDYVGLLVKLSSPTNEPLTSSDFQVSKDEDNETLRYHNVRLHRTITGRMIKITHFSLFCLIAAISRPPLRLDTLFHVNYIRQAEESQAGEF